MAPNASTIEETERLVRALYRGVLRREPDEDGVAGCVSAILGGMSPAAAAEMFVGSEEFRAATSLKVWVPPGHFFSPIGDAAEADRRLAQIESHPVPDSLPGIAIDRAEMGRTWHRLLPFMISAPFSAGRSAGVRYAYDNPAYAWADGAVLHAMLRCHRPRKLIEVGSGWSSACIIDTVVNYLGDECELTFIEPYPQLLHEVVGAAASSVRILERRVQDLSVDMFEQLASGDVLFIDSTHVLRTGGDVCFELFEILPRLASGVLVHIHDMFWPFEYPRVWAVDEGRWWNELYAVRAFLTSNHDWHVLFFNDYFAKLERSVIESTFPQFLNNAGGALWLQRRV